MTFEELKKAFCAYVENDFVASSLGYVRQALEFAGIGEAEAKEIGLGWVFEED